LKWPA
jgi:hypothetical protein